MYYPCSENKEADQLRGFTFTDCWFSHGVAHLLMTINISLTHKKQSILDIKMNKTLCLEPLQNLRVKLEACKIYLSPPVISLLLLIVPMRYFCGGSYYFMSWC